MESAFENVTSSDLASAHLQIIVIFALTEDA
ncbi:hypothetical protein XHV734_0767 [Xanthomonas hortorum pv. vitians]|nr:hypothetical protein XGA_3285 [Xanthomonas hortorum ATCC 19865]QNM59605.1 hypothetical protein XHV734_0767 [Xanthomonas hortorum pv. vitians]